MAAEKVVEAVVDQIRTAGLVQIEVSARHVHLDKESVEALFGVGHKLPRRESLASPDSILRKKELTLLDRKAHSKTLQFLDPRESTFRLRSHSAMLLPLESIRPLDSRATPKVPQA